MAVTQGYDLAALKKQYDEQGYVVVDGMFAQQDFGQLRRAARQVTDLTRQGKWKHRRIVGKQFPPFNNEQSKDSWGVQHLMHPDLPHSGLFTSFYGSSPLLDIAARLLDTREENMQLELFNLLIEPEDHAFALGWHRDDVRPDVSQAEERVRLAAPTYGVQWNACLYDDDCLFIVPGTHVRLRNQAEIKANQQTPPSARPIHAAHDNLDLDGAWDIDPPSTLRVQLKAGQTVFYSQRILHRASYLPSRTRATLHGCYGETGVNKENGRGYDAQRVAVGERARNVLQVSSATTASKRHRLTFCSPRSA
jgi:hypothetical protein